MNGISMRLATLTGTAALLFGIAPITLSQDINLERRGSTSVRPGAAIQPNPIDVGQPSCRKLTIDGPMYIQSAPTVYSEAIDVVYPGQRMEAIATPGKWIQITEPSSGYIFSRYVASCTPEQRL